MLWDGVKMVQKESKLIKRRWLFHFAQPWKQRLSPRGHARTKWGAKFHIFIARNLGNFEPGDTNVPGWEGSRGTGELIIVAIIS